MLIFKVVFVGMLVVAAITALGCALIQFAIGVISEIY